MTVEERKKIIEENCHNEVEREILTRATRDFLYFVDPDEHLKYLVDQLVQTISEQYNNMQWKPIIFTKPKLGLNAGALSINEKCKLLIIDSNVVILTTTMSQLIAKAIPKYKNGIIPSKDDEELDDEEIEGNISRINTLIGIDDYNNFYKAIFNINWLLDNPLSDVSNPDKLTEQLRDSILMFLISHEFAHMLLEHKDYKDRNTLNGMAQNWIYRETPADVLGYELMRNTMSRIYPNVEYKAEYNLGFEIYLKCYAVGELLSFIFRKKADEKNDQFFSGTHPDAGGSRLDTLRKVVEEDIPKEINEENEDTIFESEMEIGSFLYIMDISNTVFDSYEKRLIEEIIKFAVIYDKQYTKEKDFHNRIKNAIMNSICNTDIGYIDTETSGLDEWKAGKYTRAIIMFANKVFNEKFYRILSALHCYEYEKYFFRMFSCIGPGEGFAEGVHWLNSKIFFNAIEPLKYVHHNEPNNPLAAFALGYAYSKTGEEYFYKKDFQNALEYLKLGIETSPIVRRKTFMLRSEIFKKSGNAKEAEKDDKIYHILRLVPNTREIAEKQLDSI